MRLIVKEKIDHTSKTTMPSLVARVHTLSLVFHMFAALLILPDLVLVSCPSQNDLGVETKVFGGSVQGVVTIVCHYTEFRLSGVASPC